MPTSLTIDRYAHLIMTMVEEDIATSVVPATVTSFTDLHDHVDANSYLDRANVPWGANLATGSDPAGVNVVNATTDRVTELLVARITTHGRQTDAAGHPVTYDGRGFAYVMDDDTAGLWYVTQCCGSPVTWSVAAGFAELCCKGCGARQDRRLADLPTDQTDLNRSTR